MEQDYKFLETLFLRAAFYSADDYDLNRLAEVLGDAVFRNALWLASPGFYRVLEKKGFDAALLDGKERFSVVKYYNRMSFRPVPFGAFASFTLAAWADTDGLRLVEGTRAVLRVLPSREWQAELEAVLKAGSPDLMLRANPTINRVGDRLRYVRAVWDDMGKARFQVNALPAERINTCLAGLTGAKAVSQSEVLKRLEDMTGCRPAEARDYLGFLIREQAVLTELDGCLIGHAGSGLLGKTWARNYSPVMALDRFWKDMAHVSLSGPAGLPALAEKLEALGGEAGIKQRGNHFYGGLKRPVERGGIDRETQQHIRAALKVLQRIVIPYHTPALKNFKAAFRLKFEEQKVPFLTALDPDTGINYGELHTGTGGKTLLDGLSFPEAGRGGKELDWTGVHRLFLRIWLRNGQRSAGDPVEIREEDLGELESVRGDFKLPPTIAVLFSMAGGKLNMDSAGGASATALIGRFSVFSPEVHALCRELVKAERESNPEVLFAEIHQLSDMHSDNINRRMPVYDQVIHIDSFPAETGQRRLALNDLLLSVRGDELLLESVSLGKRIIPRLPTAFNFHHNELAIFQMLCDLQFQGLQANLNFDPEKLFPGLDFYPRIVYGNTVLSLAKWHLNEKEKQELLSTPRSLGRLHLFRQGREIPRLVTMGLSDQQLVFDLGNDAEAWFFLDCLKTEKRATLREYLQPDRSVTAGNQRLAGQAVALLKRGDMVYKGLIPSPPGRSAMPRRHFPPGSEWLYLKIYCTPETADRLLVKVIHPVLRAKSTLVDRWFFIRYQDPEHHLRLRIKTTGTGFGKLLTAFERKFALQQNRGFVRELQTDTYQREIERYSPELIDAAETVFWAGSEWVMADLPAKHDGMVAAAAGLVPFFLVYHMAQTFLKDISGLSLFFSWRTDGFLREFGDAKRLRVDMDNKYRSISRELQEVLEDRSTVVKPNDVHPAELQVLLDRLSGMAVATGSWPAEKQHVLLADLIHMQVNRMFTSRQRQHEALICYGLHKYAQSLKARLKSGT